MKSFKYRITKIGILLQHYFFLISKEECKARIRYLKQIVYAKPLTDPQFPNTALPVNTTSGSVVVPRHRRVAIMASFSITGTITPPLLFYLSELKKVTDAIVFVADNPLMPNEVEKLLPLVDFIQCEHHGEYDFGSYKRGLAIAEKNGLLNEADQLVFCNDSCYGPFRPFQEFFDLYGSADFCGMTFNQDGYLLDAPRLYFSESPHIQSYFFAVSRRVFQRESFRHFFQSIHKLPSKVEIIYRYEQGLSKLLMSEGIKPETLFPHIIDSWTPRKKVTNWYQIVQKGFLLKKDILCFPAFFQMCNQLIEPTIFPFQIKSGQFVPRTMVGKNEK